MLPRAVTIKLLAVGDLHLGRRPSRLTPEVGESFDARALGPAEAWRRTVDAALDARVDAVALAGDVVEREDDFFEAYGALRAGVARLVEAGVRVLAVAGNHDVQVLPRLAGELQGFELLGARGRWERAELAAGGVEAVVWGWSFPQPRVTESPLAGAHLERDGRPTLGLLHADRDATVSPYAPVGSGELAAAGLDGWLLGHVHRPDELAPPNPCGYLGSVTGLDPGELGARGPWLVEIGAGGVERVVHWRLAPLRWEVLAVDLTGLADPEAAPGRILAAIGQLDAGIAGAPHRPDLVGLRLRLVGRSARRREVEERLRGTDLGSPRDYTGSGVAYFVSDRRIELAPEIDLAALARGTDPPGLLARRLLALDAAPEDPRRRELLAAARERLEAAARRVGAGAFSEPELDDEALADRLRRAGTEALDRLLAQRPEAL